MSFFSAGLLLCSVVHAQEQISLGALIGETFATHPALRGQQGMQEAAQAGVAAARWQFYPTPSLSLEQASTATNDPSYRGDQRVTTVGVRQSLWTGGRLTGNLAKTEAQDLAARAESEGIRQQLALRVLQGRPIFSMTAAGSGGLLLLRYQQSSRTYTDRGRAGLPVTCRS